jgi:hypothetical protein
MKMATNILAGTIITSALALQQTQSKAQTENAHSESIQSFKVHFPDEDLQNLRQRILVTRWPEKETVADATQGVPLATVQKLAHYWATDYDWHKAEAKLNAFPQFTTIIDGLNIHFIHVRSRHPLAWLCA